MGARGVEHAQRKLDLAEVAAANRLVVGYQHGGARAPPDLERLFDRGHQSVHLVAHVRGVKPAMATDDADQFGELVDVGVNSRHVGKAGREAERAALHRRSHQRFHALEFGA